MVFLLTLTYIPQFVGVKGVVVVTTPLPLVRGEKNLEVMETRNPCRTRSQT